jgi:hypothetical protein
MRSVADQLREESRRRVQAMEPAARLELALRLGDDDATLLAVTRGIPEAEARHELARRRQTGRRASASKQR